MFRSASRIILLALLLLPLGLSHAAAQEDGERSFAGSIASHMNFVLQSADVALSRGQEQSVRAFAETVTESQQRVAEELGEALVEEGIEPSPDLSDEDRTKLQALETSSPDQFDNAYLSAKATVLESMIQLMMDYAENGSAGPLKTFASNQIGGTRTLYLRAQDLSAR